jgi:hypothetical protein
MIGAGGDKIRIWDIQTGTPLVDSTMTVFCIISHCLKIATVHSSYHAHITQVQVWHDLIILGGDAVTIWSLMTPF